jgi:hypothetical protein
MGVITKSFPRASGRTAVSRAVNTLWFNAPIGPRHLRRMPDGVLLRTVLRHLLRHHVARGCLRNPIKMSAEKEELVGLDAIPASDLRELVRDLPRLASRFYRSLAVVGARRLRETSRELALALYR